MDRGERGDDPIMRTCAFFVLLSLFADPFPAILAGVSNVDEAHALFDDGGMPTAPHPSWFKESFLDLEEDMEEAIGAGKKGILIFFDTEGCSYCARMLEYTFGDPHTATQTQRHFDVVGLDLFQDDDMTDFSGQSTVVKAFAKREGAVASPSLIFYGAGGERLYRTAGYYPPDRFRLLLDYVVGEHYLTHRFGDFVRRYQPPTSEAKYQPTVDPLFDGPPYMLDRRMPAQQPLLVLFERAGCGDCRRFHEFVLQHPPVRKLLVEFDLVQLDIDDHQTPVVAPSGERTTPEDWGKTLGIAATPSLIYFSRDGQELLRFENLILRQRMERSLMYVLEGAYEDGRIYQRFTREKSIEKLLREQRGRE
jgi:thioredoxin-related protein